MTVFDTQQCPLCLGPNSCGNTKDSITSCWCFQETISNELLGEIPEAAKGRQCICQQCLNNQRSKN